MVQVEVKKQKKKKKKEGEDFLGRVNVDPVGCSLYRVEYRV